jgi:hypothetical protein
LQDHPVKVEFILRLSLALAGVFFLVPEVSQALTLDCTLQPTESSSGWVTERYVLQHDPDTGKALASDAIILHFLEAPVDATVSEDTGKKLVLSWNIQMTNNSGQMTKMLYRAAYFKANGTITVRAVPSGYTNNFEARGTCRPV